MPNIEKGESLSDYLAKCIPYCMKNEGLDRKAAAGKCAGMWKQHQKTGKQYTAEELEIIARFSQEDFESFEPPEAGDAPDKVKSILRSAYSSCRSKWVKDHPSDKENAENKTSCSKQAWAAVHNAGWKKDADGKWKHFEAEWKLYNFECSLQEFSLQTPLIEQKNEKGETIQSEDKNWVKFRAVAVIGNRMMRNVFVPYEELKKSLSMWEGTYHDINHMGTSYPDTNFPFKRQNIEYFVGYQDNVKADDNTKEISMDVNINKNSPKYASWKSFVDINAKAGKIPNVSMSILARSKRVKVKDLNFDSKIYGLENEDFVECLYDIIPKALTTCVEGECNSSNGCGIATKFDKEESCGCSSCNCKINDKKIDDKKTDNVVVSDEDAKYLTSLVEKTKKLKDEKYLAELNEKIKKQKGGK